MVCDFLICALERDRSDFYLRLHRCYGGGFLKGLFPCGEPCALRTNLPFAGGGRCPDALEKMPWDGRRPGPQKQLPATQREPFSLGFLEGAGLACRISPTPLSRPPFPLCGPASLSSLMPPGFAVPARNFIAVRTWCFAVSPHGAGTLHTPAAATATFPSLPRPAARPGATGPQPPCPSPDRPPARGSAATQPVLLEQQGHAACSSAAAGDTQPAVLGNGAQRTAVRSAARPSAEPPALTAPGSAVKPSAPCALLALALCALFIMSLRSEHLTFFINKQF